MNWNMRYASEKDAGIGDTLKALNPFKRKPEPQIAPGAYERACKCHNNPMSQCPDVSTEYLNSIMPTDQERLESSINSRVNNEIIKQIL